MTEDKSPFLNSQSIGKWQGTFLYNWKLLILLDIYKEDL